jgi:hypothetical protein
MMQKLFYKPYVYACIIVPSLSFGDVLANLSGDIGMDYVRQSAKSDIESKTNKLSEVLNLKYRSFLYDRRFLDYYFHVKFAKSDEKGEDTNRSISNSHSNTEYDISLNFLQKSFMPFEIKAKHSAKPSTIINEDSIVETTFDKSDYSLRGNVATSYVNINYNVALSQSETTSQLGEKELDSDSVDIHFSKELKDETRLSLGLSQSNSDSKILYGDFLQELRNKRTVSTSYSNEQLKLNLNYTQRNEEDNDVNDTQTYTIDNLSSFFSYNISEQLNLSNSLETEKNGKDDSKTNTANIRVRWNPTSSYDAVFSLDTNEYKVDNEKYNNYTFFASSNYRINKNWSNSQNLNFLDVKTPSSTHRSYMLSTVTNYTKKLTAQTDVYGINSITYIQNQNNSLIQTTQIGDDSSFIIDTTAGVNRRWNFWNARNGYEFNYVKTMIQNDNNDANDGQKIKLSTYLTTLPMTNVEFNIEGDISQENRNDKDIQLGQIKGFLKYTKHIDVRGRLSVNSGLLYKFEKEDEVRITSVNPSLSLAFDYRLWRTLNFKSFYDIIVDESNKTTNHTLNTGLHYKFRNFEVNLTTNIIRQYKEEDADFMSEMIMLSMKRKF